MQDRRMLMMSSVLFDDGERRRLYYDTFIMLQRCHVRNRYALGLRVSNVPNALTGEMLVL
jgi:hypothetical protein